MHCTANADGVYTKVEGREYMSRIESKVESKVEDPRHVLSTLDTRLLYTLTQMYNLAAHPSSALNMGSKFTDIITTYITESWKLRNKLLNLIS